MAETWDTLARERELSVASRPAVRDYADERRATKFGRRLLTGPGAVALSVGQCRLASNSGIDVDETVPIAVQAGNLAS
jgi:hypothetical protein